jgi:hypothetical protein
MQLALLMSFSQRASREIAVAWMLRANPKNPAKEATESIERSRTNVLQNAYDLK